MASFREIIGKYKKQVFKRPALLELGMGLEPTTC